MQIFSCPMNRMSGNVGLFELIDLMFNERNKEMKRMSMPPSGQLSPATRRQKGESPQLIFLASDGAPKKKKSWSRWKWKFLAIEIGENVPKGHSFNTIKWNLFKILCSAFRFIKLNFVKLGQSTKVCVAWKLTPFSWKKFNSKIFVLWGHLSGLFITQIHLSLLSVLLFSQKIFRHQPARGQHLKWMKNSSPTGGTWSSEKRAQGGENQGQTGRRNENENPVPPDDFRMKYSSKQEKGLQQFHVFSRTWNTWPADTC